MSDSDIVLYGVLDGIADITLNRPHALNAWTPDLGKRYFDCLEEAERDPTVRAIVVTGAGRGFCAGADLDYLRDVYEGRTTSGHDPRPQSLPRTLRKPVIAAINGACAGLGLIMALMCDIRFAAAGAKLTTAFARRGLIAEYGLAWILPRLAGPSRALDLLLSGRTFLAEEAERIGVVDQLSEPGKVLDDARDYAAELIRYSSPAAMATIKRQVYDDLDQRLAEAEAAAKRYMDQSLRGHDFREGVESFLERRAPRFQPLSTDSEEVA